MKHPEIAVPEGLGEYTYALMDLEDHLRYGYPAEELDGYVGQGAVSYVFKLGDSTAGKIPQAWRLDAKDDLDVESAADSISRTLIALDRTRGLEGVEQLEGWGREPFAWCTKYVLGKTVDKCTFNEDGLEPQFERLLDAVEALTEAEISIDQASTNVMYHPINGFTIIDYATHDETWRQLVQNNPKTSLERTVSGLGNPSVLFDAYTLHSRADALPEAVLLFRGLCQERYGSKVANRIDESWDMFRNQFPLTPPQ